MKSQGPVVPGNSLQGSGEAFLAPHASGPAPVRCGGREGRTKASDASLFNALPRRPGRGWGRGVLRGRTQHVYESPDCCGVEGAAAVRERVRERGTRAFGPSLYNAAGQGD